MRRGILILVVALLGLDIFSKWIVQAYLPLMSESSPFYPYGGIGVFKNFLGIDFALTHLTNKGIIWGVLASYQLPLLILRLGLIAGLCIYLFLKKPGLIVSLPLCLIIAGAMGNVVDALVYGHVVDMLYFRFWGWGYPVFNLADSYIFIGVVWLLGRSFVKKDAKAAN